jgi:formylmethanofuran--tetrahydromethanopterin N-formyltransferase
MKRILSIILAAAAVALSGCGPKDGEYTFRILSTNDVHGHYFCESYTSDQTVPSFMAAAWHIDTVRVANGAENVILIDAGDAIIDAIMGVEGATAPFDVCSAASKPETNFPEIGPTTNHVYCPSLKESLGDESKVPERVNYIPEIVVNAISEESMNNAIKAGIDAALEFEGVIKISAGNFDGKLGDKNINLLDILK